MKLHFIKDPTIQYNFQTSFEVNDFNENRAVYVSNSYYYENIISTLLQEWKEVWVFFGDGRYFTNYMFIWELEQGRTGRWAAKNEPYYRNSVSTIKGDTFISLKPIENSIHIINPKYNDL